MPNNLQAIFTVSPSAPTEDSTVLFDASASVPANPSSTIVSYQWDFGDGGTGSGKQVTHKFTPGNKTVKLTIADATNRTGTGSQVLTIGGTTQRPTASFSFSPANPQFTHNPIFFDASLSTAAGGRRIVSYTWNFGDGNVQTVSDPRISHSYSTARTYNVSLIVTDENGKTSTNASTAPIIVQ